MPPPKDVFCHIKPNVLLTKESTVTELELDRFVDPKTLIFEVIVCIISSVFIHQQQAGIAGFPNAWRELKSLPYR
jgi:hypothetical protein